MVRQFINKYKILYTFFLSKDLFKIYNCVCAGFSNSDPPCCAFGRIGHALACVPASTLCKYKRKYLFWDEYHHADSANELIAA